MKNKWQPPLPPFRDYKEDVYKKQAKTAQFIHQLGEMGTIRTPSGNVPIVEITSSLMKQKIMYLKQCMLKYRKITGVGRGIAAVQVGILERFAVIYTPERKEKLFTIINPEITKKSEALLCFPEGCMSEGPTFAPVIRPAWIEFTYYDENGKKQYWDTKDTDRNSRLNNRVFQHEIDHMNGIIFFDRADLSKLTLDSDPTFYEKAAFTPVP
jgi:peptide deformylase